jgi:hypothetical protein
MEIVSATITDDGGKVIVADVEVTIIESLDRLHGWRGLLVARGFLDIKPGSGPYLLKTKDGRSGQIVIRSIKPWFTGPASTRVEFDAAGPLEIPAPRNLESGRPGGTS